MRTEKEISRQNLTTKSFMRIEKPLRRTTNLLLGVYLPALLKSRKLKFRKHQSLRGSRVFLLDALLDLLPAGQCVERRVGFDPGQFVGKLAIFDRLPYPSGVVAL